MSKYYLKVNYKIKDGRKAITTYDLYNNDKLIKSFDKDASKTITSMAKSKNIEYIKKGNTYTIDNTDFINSFYRLPIKRKKFRPKKLKKKIVITALTVTTILYALYGKNNSKDVLASDNDFNIETTDNNDIYLDNEEINIIDIDNSIYEDEDFIKIDTLNEDYKSINDQNINIDTTAYTYVFNYQDRSNENYVSDIKNKYGEYIDNCSEEYGIDSNFIISIICQENKNNEKNYSNIGGHGLMQVESIWDGESITAYNFKTNSFETITIDTLRATDDDEYGIKVGCMIFNNYYNYINKNYDLSDEECLIATLFAYNKGIGTITKNLNNGNFNDFLEGVKNSNGGDNEYIEHVLSHLHDNTELNMKTNDNTIHNIIIDNLSVNEYNKL